MTSSWLGLTLTNLTSTFGTTGWTTVPTIRLVLVLATVPDSDPTTRAKRVTRKASASIRAQPILIAHRDRHRRLMVGSTVEREPMPAFLYVYVEDTDAAFSLALKYGAKPIEQPQETPYGDRRGMIRDRWGNTWQIATHRGEFKG